VGKLNKGFSRRFIIARVVNDDDVPDPNQTTGKRRKAMRAVERYNDYGELVNYSRKRRIIHGWLAL
jgi:hypothetical protein